MNKISILIDSTSTIENQYLEKNHIQVIANSVNDNDGNVYEDDCTDEQKLKIAKKIEDDVVMKTSLINEQKIYEKIQELLKKNEQVIFLCIGPGFSGQYNNALNVQQKIGTDRLLVLHTNSTACQSEMVLHWLVQKISDKQFEWNQNILQNEILELSNHITTMFTTNIYKGFINAGRVPSIVAKTLKLTKTFPVIQAEDTNTRERFFRKWNHAIENILDAIDKRFNKPPRGKDIKELYLCQSLCKKEIINDILEKMANHFKFNINEIKIRTTPLCVLMTTCLNSFGMAIWTNESIVKKKK